MLPLSSPSLWIRCSWNLTCNLKFFSKNTTLWIIEKSYIFIASEQSILLQSVFICIHASTLALSTCFLVEELFLECRNGVACGAMHCFLLSVKVLLLLLLGHPETCFIWLLASPLTIPTISSQSQVWNLWNHCNENNEIKGFRFFYIFYTNIYIYIYIH